MSRFPVLPVSPRVFTQSGHIAVIDAHDDRMMGSAHFAIIQILLQQESNPLCKLLKTLDWQRSAEEIALVGMAAYTG